MVAAAPAPKPKVSKTTSPPVEGELWAKAPADKRQIQKTVNNNLRMDVPFQNVEYLLEDSMTVHEGISEMHHALVTIAHSGVFIFLMKRGTRALVARVRVTSGRNWRA